MKPIEYKIGEKLGECFFIKRTVIKNGQSYAIFKCRCNNEFEARIQSVKSYLTRSCGCYASSVTITRSTIHGLSKQKTYKIWDRVKSRCYNKNNSSYKWYGGRGIKVYEPWRKSFELFHNYISKLPDYNISGYTLDRINNDGNYEPGNLRWVNQHYQVINSRINSKNKSGFKGVSYMKDAKKWRAGITIHGKIKNIGNYNTAIEAVIARDRYILKHELFEYPLQILTCNVVKYLM